ncbi:hypothetical protein C6P46_000318 [Rhodotorula mucilaginosa]|uniref:Uncharacterized protein n=1 Tax=Rhodotorula mucilaginosa TaxID=5537 RepID=A0A9P6W7U2_RHOMI|nr:hypothetical protein C6P46_000318 [Rhodotorula mucilaginosa]
MRVIHHSRDPSTGKVERQLVPVQPRNRGGDHKRERPDHFEMLLSPSRGVQDDESSLRNPQVQEQFRAHLRTKMHTWAAGPRRRASRQEELATILLDFRELQVLSDRFGTPPVYEASVLLALANSNEPQLASALPHLVMTLYPSHLTSLDPSSSKDPVNQPSTRSGDQSSIASRLADLSLSSPHKNAAADSAHRAFFVALHLLHSSLLPAESAAPQSVAGGETTASSGPPPASSCLPAFEAALSANRLTIPSTRTASSPTAEGRPYSHHPDPHLDFLLRLRLALEANSYADLAANLLSLEAIPSPPASILAHLSELHLSSPSRQQDERFNPLATLLRTFVPRLRQNRIWPVVQRAYRFPPDATEWLGSLLLFEFEVEFELLENARAREEEEGAKVDRGARPVVQVAEEWDADESEDEAERGARAAQRGRIRTEAARRAAAWVVERSKK